MSPCPPSRLCLEESQPQYSVHDLGLRNKSYLKQTLKYKQLSPVMESSFSDCSNIEKQESVPDSSRAVSCFSSKNPVEQKTQYHSSDMWESSCAETEFQPFCHSGVDRNDDYWIPLSKETQQQDQETSQFGYTLKKSQNIALVGDERTTFTHNQGDSGYFDTDAFIEAHLLQQGRQLESVFTGPEEMFSTNLRKPEKTTGHILPTADYSHFFIEEKEEDENHSFVVFENGKRSSGQGYSQNCKEKIHLEGNPPLYSKNLQESRSSQPEDVFLFQVSKQMESGHSPSDSISSYESQSYSPRESTLSTISDFSEEDCNNLQVNGPVPEALFTQKHNGILLCSKANETGDHNRNEENPDRKNVECQNVQLPLKSRFKSPDGFRLTEKKHVSYIREVGTQTDSIFNVEKLDSATQCNLGKLCEACGFASESNSITEKLKITNRGQTSSENEIMDSMSDSSNLNVHTEMEYITLKNLTVKEQQNDTTASEEISANLKETKSLTGLNETNCKSKHDIFESLKCSVSTDPKSIQLHVSTNMRHFNGSTRDELNLKTCRIGAIPICQTLYDENQSDSFVDMNGNYSKDKEYESTVKRNSEETKTLHEIADILLMLGHKKIQ
nr:PREDICTED: uncharacterized protein C12orf40 homolog isoform X2 [Lepisosteus oculatus]XP_015208085.1 PREDICTED: uncharacterized protein C12orf40 homolog isoform X2 [Lepisosteus oculatus]